MHVAIWGSNVQRLQNPVLVHLVPAESFDSIWSNDFNKCLYHKICWFHIHVRLNHRDYILNRSRLIIKNHVPWNLALQTNFQSWLYTWVEDSHAICSQTARLKDSSSTEFRSLTISFVNVLCWYLLIEGYMRNSHELLPRRVKSPYKKMSDLRHEKSVINWRLTSHVKTWL